MGWKRKLGGGLLAFVGFMLSPLSWWNDAVVNIPLALVFGWGVSLIYRPAFAASVVVGYWLTNVLGFILLHKGAQTFLAKSRAYSRRELLKDAAVSLAYTGLILVLLWLKVLKPVGDYFPAH